MDNPNRNGSSSTEKQDSISIENEESLIKELPDVVWDVVFSFLKPTDLVRVSKTGTGMKRLVNMKRRPEYLQPVILEGMVGELDRQDLLNCRLVCKFWKLSVDKVLADLPLREQNPFLESDHNMFSQLNLTSINQITTFMESVTNYNGNPIIGRNLHLENSSDEEDYWQNVTRLLQRIGHEIIHVHLIFNQNSTDTVSLESVLCLLPSLKRLEIDTNVEFLQDQYVVRPFLKHVEMFIGIGSISSPLFRDIMENCIDSNNITTMRLCSQEITNHMILPSLTFLKLEIQEEDDIDCVQKLECPLKSIHIVDVSYDDDDENGCKWIQFELKQLLNCFSQFSATLKEIYMKVAIMNCADLDEHAICFPALEMFQVYHFGGELNSFPTIPSLQELIFMNSWKPIEYGYSERCEAQYLVDMGKADEETLSILETNEENLGTNDILNELRNGAFDIWNRFENLKTVWCSSYKFIRKCE